MLSYKNRILPLLDAIADGRIAANQIPPARRGLLLRNKDPEIQARATRVLADSAVTPRKQVIDKYNVALTLKGDVRGGQTVFQTNCMICHRLGEQGNEVGPNLSTIRQWSAEQMMVNILDPNREVAPNFLQYLIELKDGQSLVGLIADETPTSINLRNAGGVQQTVLRQNIASMASLGVSLMPEGVEANINRQQMADLLAFLRQPETPSSSPLTLLPPPDAKGFTQLFNGRDFAGWKSNDALRAVWSLHDSRLHAKGGVKGGGFDLWSEKSYRDLELYVDWRLPAAPVPKALPTFTPDGLYARDPKGQIIRKEIPDAGDSGIFLRGDAKYQVNLWSQPMGSGDINELHKDASLPPELRRQMLPKVKADAPFGQWNRFYITLKGDRVTVVLNGQTVIDHVPMPGIAPEGPIALQYHGDEIEFANIFLREL
jgi:putative heme-binding domain-containing protein